MKEDFDNYNLEEEEEEPAARYTMWQLLPVIMVMPVKGWRKVFEGGPSPEIAVLRFLLPLSFLSGAAAFFAYLYPGAEGGIGVENNLRIVLVNAVIQFCSFFIGYYVALLLAKVFLPKGTADFLSTRYGKLLTMTGVGTLALFHIIFQAFQMFDFILVFLPLWTIFLIYKGMERIEFNNDKRLPAIGVICVVIVAAPTIVEWTLTLFA